MKCIENQQAVWPKQQVLRPVLKNQEQKNVQNNIETKSQNLQTSDSSQKTVGLGVLGVLLLCLFRGKNQNSFKVLRQVSEKPARNGGKYVSEAYKKQIKNTDGSMSEVFEQKIKTKYDKYGVITSRSVNDVENNICSTVLYDKKGLPCRKIVYKYSESNPFAVDYKVTHDFVRNGENVKITSVLSTFDNKTENVVLKTNRTGSVAKINADYIDKLSNPFVACNA